MAQELTATLAAHRADRMETVGAMRHNHQESLQQMQRDLHAMLDETNKARHEAVTQFRTEAQKGKPRWRTISRGIAGLARVHRRLRPPGSG